MIQAYRYVENRLEPVAADALEAGHISGLVWIDLQSPTTDENRLVERQLSVLLPTREEMEEIEVSARLYQEDGSAFMTLTAVTKIDTEEPATTPITFVLKGDTLVTLRHTVSKAFDGILARAQKPHAIPCASGDQVMLALVESLCDRMADALEGVGRAMDVLSRSIFRRKPGEKASASTQVLQSTIEKIGQDGDLLTKVRESLVSINRMLTYHTALAGNDKQKGKDGRGRSKLLYRDVVALTDQATFLSNKVNFLLDATLGLINLQQNQIIKIFSVAAVVFLPPTLVASVYGMNFSFMPELRWMLGYPWAIVLMIVSAAVPFLYFKRRGWL